MAGDEEVFPRKCVFFTTPYTVHFFKKIFKKAVQRAHIVNKNKKSHMYTEKWIKVKQ